MNTVIARTEGAKARVLSVEWGYTSPRAVEIRYNDDSDGEVAFLNTGYPWESSCGILHEDLVEAA